jgi:2-polyprenyl-3-methyl-5-hydroxy-6-metoxy-1,4-benzoquinol methylase
MKPSKQQVEAGQAVYSKSVLSIYDIVVLGISNRWIWKCKSSNILAHYNANISSNHLDVGVGTGYFLDRCQFPSDKPRVGIMDLNQNTLDFAARRIARYTPETYQQNILEPIETEIKVFDSVGINYLFHCVPGSLTEKTVAFDHLKVLMNPGCQIFGSTILQGGVPTSWSAKKLMKTYNKKGIFSNTKDSLKDLQTALTQRFQDVKVEVIGCVALFSGRL